MKPYRLLSVHRMMLLMIITAMGFMISCNNEKPVYIQPQSSTSIDAAPWGVEFTVLPPHIGRYPDELEHITRERIDSVVKLASELGIKWVRLSVDWANVVDREGNYHWDQVDRIIDGLLENKIEIALCVNGGHAKYTDRKAPVSEEAIAYWKDYVTVFVSRYKDKIKYWELWNEPNTVWFWKPSPKAADYVALMEEFHSIVKDLIPDARIIGGAMARLDMEFADTILQLGIDRYIDAITYHPYNEIPEAMIRNIRVPARTPLWYVKSDHSIYEFRDMVDRADPAIELWQGECGYPSEDNGSGWTGNGPWSPNIQAKWLLRRMLTDLSYNAQVIKYFCMVEYYTSQNVDEGTGSLNSKGLLTVNDLKAKPSYSAFQNLISVLNGDLVAQIADDYHAEVLKDGSFHNVMQKNMMFLDVENEKGQDFMAYWIVWRMQDRVDNASVNIHSDKKFDDPVLVNLLSGEVQKIKTQEQNDGQQWMELPLADYPFIITSMNNLKTQ